MTQTITEKVAYLKGLSDGLDLEKNDSREGKLIAKIIDVLEDMGLAVEQLKEDVTELKDNVEELEEEIDDFETLFLDGGSSEPDNILDFTSCCGQGCPDGMDDDDMFKVSCPSCGENVVIDESVLDKGEISCPNCGHGFQLELFDSESDKDED